LGTSSNSKVFSIASQKSNKFYPHDMMFHHKFMTSRQGTVLSGVCSQLQILRISPPACPRSESVHKCAQNVILSEEEVPDFFFRRATAQVKRNNCDDVINRKIILNENKSNSLLTLHLLPTTDCIAR
jgi:hypothetical protein